MVSVACQATIFIDTFASDTVFPSLPPGLGLQSMNVNLGSQPSFSVSACERPDTSSTATTMFCEEFDADSLGEGMGASRRRKRPLRRQRARQRAADFKSAALASAVEANLEFGIEHRQTQGHLIHALISVLESDRESIDVPSESPSWFELESLVTAEAQVAEMQSAASSKGRSIGISALSAAEGAAADIALKDQVGLESVDVALGVERLTSAISCIFNRWDPANYDSLTVPRMKQELQNDLCLVDTAVEIYNVEIRNVMMEQFTAIYHPKQAPNNRGRKRDRGR